MFDSSVLATSSDGLHPSSVLATSICVCHFLIAVMRSNPL